MSLRGHLQINLTDESKAYGYTLVIWGSGAILIDKLGFPGSEAVLLYILGALAGFAALSVLVYGNVFREVTNIKDEVLVVASMVHLIAAMGAVGLSVIIARYLPVYWAFFTAGVNATVSYNLLMLAEVALSEELASHPWR